MFWHDFMLVMRCRWVRNIGRVFCQGPIRDLGGFRSLWPRGPIRHWSLHCVGYGTWSELIVVVVVLCRFFVWNQLIVSVRTVSKQGLPRILIRRKRSRRVVESVEVTQIIAKGCQSSRTELHVLTPCPYLLASLNQGSPTAFFSLCHFLFTKCHNLCSPHPRRSFCEAEQPTFPERKTISTRNERRTQDTRVR